MFGDAILELKPDRIHSNSQIMWWNQPPEKRRNWSNQTTKFEEEENPRRTEPKNMESTARKIWVRVQKIKSMRKGKMGFVRGIERSVCVRLLDREGTASESGGRRSADLGVFEGSKHLPKSEGRNVSLSLSIDRLEEDFNCENTSAAAILVKWNRIGFGQAHVLPGCKPELKIRTRGQPGPGLYGPT